MDAFRSLNFVHWSGPIPSRSFGNANNTARKPEECRFHLFRKVSRVRHPLLAFFCFFILEGNLKKKLASSSTLPILLLNDQIFRSAQPLLGINAFLHIFLNPHLHNPLD